VTDDRTVGGEPLRGYTVRPARPDELDDAGRVVAAAYRAVGDMPADYLDEVAKAAARAEHGEVLVAVDSDHRVLGSVTFVMPGSQLAELSRDGEAEFRMLGVGPAAQGRGVGRALLQACIERSLAVAAHRLVLCSASNMAAAHRMYESVGFRRAPELDWEPEPGVRLVAYALPLG
jgi:ribosomal protein S18 acetylase RimI-like enzyme